MDVTLREIVRIANHELGDFIRRFSEQGRDHGKCLEAAKRLGKISLRLKQVERLLAERTKHRSEGAEIDRTILEYEENLKALRGIVEGLESTLLARRSRFEHTRAHLQAADAWARSVRQIS